MKRTIKPKRKSAFSFFRNEAGCSLTPQKKNMQTHFHQSALSSFFFKKFFDCPFKNLSRLKPSKIQASLDQTEKPAGYIMIIPNKISETFSHLKN